jgi:hypothetical protein
MGGVLTKRGARGRSRGKDGRCGGSSASEGARRREQGQASARRSACRREQRRMAVAQAMAHAGVSESGGSPKGAYMGCVTNVRLQAGFAAPLVCAFEGSAIQGGVACRREHGARQGRKPNVGAYDRAHIGEGFGPQFLRHHAGRRLLEEQSDAVGPPKRRPAGPLLPRYRNS